MYIWVTTEFFHKLFSAKILLTLPQFDTYIDLQTYLDNELSKREREVDNILYYWLTKSRNSEIFYQTDKGFCSIDTSKTQNHYKLVNLYNVLINSDLTFKERKNPHDISLKTISPRVNNKRLRDFNDFNEKQEKAKQRISSIREYADNIATDLKLKYSIDEIKNDVTGTREIIKKLFKDIFPLYGIDLDDKVINRIFGRIEFKKQKVDTISLFTNNTSFAGSLSRQFSTTQNEQANGLFSAFFMRSAGLLESYGNDRNLEQIEEIKSSSTHNPFFKEKQALRILAKIYTTCYSEKKFS